MKECLSFLALALAFALPQPSPVVAQEAAMAAVMAEWMKNAEPGDHHEALDPPWARGSSPARFA